MGKVDLNTYVRKKDGGFQYIIRYKDGNGKWKTAFSKQGFKSKPEAERAMANRLDEAEKLAKGELKNNKVTFEDYYNDYIDHIKLYRQYNTIKGFRVALPKFKPLYKKEISKITYKDIQNIIDKLVIEKYKHNTIQAYLKCIKVVFRSAQKDNVICELPKFDNIEMVNNDILEVKKVLTPIETENMLNSFKDTEFYLFLLIACKTGMRLGEVFGLTWDDIDFKNDKIVINKQWKEVGKNKYDFGVLKSKNSKRIIDLPNSIKTYLQGVASEGRVLKQVNHMHAFERRLNRNLLNKYGLTIHGLRHSFATNLLSSGVDYKTTADILGHSINICMNTYSHVNTDMKIKAKSIINEIY